MLHVTIPIVRAEHRTQKKTTVTMTTVMLLQLICQKYAQKSMRHLLCTTNLHQRTADKNKTQKKQRYTIFTTERAAALE